MLTTEQLKNLKQVNVSKDAELTKTRLKEDFSSASNAEKKKIEELSGQKRSSFYRAYNRGSVNARLVLAMAQVLKTTPLYYTGEDEKKPLDKEHVVDFLNAHGYRELAASISDTEPRARRKYDRRQKENLQPAEVTAREIPMESSVRSEAREAVSLEHSDTTRIILNLPDSQIMQNAIAELSEDNAVLLLKALLLRGKAGGEAADYATCVKWLLLL